jgi:hypothetical protein
VFVVSVYVFRLVVSLSSCAFPNRTLNSQKPNDLKQSTSTEYNCRQTMCVKRANPILRNMQEKIRETGDQSHPPETSFTRRTPVFPSKITQTQPGQRAAGFKTCGFLLVSCRLAGNPLYFFCFACTRLRPFSQS